MKNLLLKIAEFLILALFFSPWIILMVHGLSEAQKWNNGTYERSDCYSCADDDGQ